MYVSTSTSRWQQNVFVLNDGCKQLSKIGSPAKAIKAVLSYKHGYVTRDEDGDVVLRRHGTFQQLKVMQRLWSPSATVRIAIADGEASREFFVMAAEEEEGVSFHLHKYVSSGLIQCSKDLVLPEIRVKQKKEEEKEIRFDFRMSGRYILIRVPGKETLFDQILVYSWGDEQQSIMNFIWDVGEFRSFSPELTTFFTSQECLIVSASYLIHVYQVQKKTSWSRTSLNDEESLPIKVGKSNIIFISENGSANIMMHRISLDSSSTLVHNWCFLSNYMDSLQCVTGLKAMESQNIFLLATSSGDGPAPESPSEWQQIHLFCLEKDQKLLPLRPKRTIQLPLPAPHTFWRVDVAESGRTLVCVPEDPEEQIHVVSLLWKEKKLDREEVEEHVYLAD